MTAILDALIDLANRTERPISEVIRHHFLEAVLRRMTVLDSAPELVLRGSLLTRIWVSPFPRAASDLDFLGTFPHDIAGTTQRVRTVLDVLQNDGVRFDVERTTSRGIWQDTAFPGVRLAIWADVFGEPMSTTVDVGFGDPLVPPATRIDYPLSVGGTTPVWVTHPHTMMAWKLHGLVEWGPRRWRPKDLLDLWLVAQTFDHDDESLRTAIVAAFRSRQYHPDDARRVLQDAERWQNRAALARWEEFRQKTPFAPIPESPATLAAEVGIIMQSTLEFLSP